MTRALSYLKSTRTITGFIGVLVLISSCTVRLVAPYDEITDRKVYELQETIGMTFKKWERNLPMFENSEAFYDQVEITLDILIERNQAIEKSDLIVSMLRYVRENLELIKQEHMKDSLTEEFITEIYPDINAQFNAIQKFQMALKRAEEND